VTVRRRIVRTCLIAVPLLVGMVVPASSAVAAAPSTAHSGGIGVRLIAGPVGPNQTALGRSYIVARLAPGATSQRRIEISNTTRSAANVSVYTAGASLDRGAFAFASGHRRNELSTWTSVSQHAVRLPPGRAAFETVTIDVPRQASAGEQYAVVWAQVSAPAPADGGITLVNRVGVRMYVSVGPGGAPPANFTVGPLTSRRSDAGYPLVVATVRNNGRRTLDIGGTLTLSHGPGGLRAGPFQVKLPAPLAPNGSELATVQLDKRLPRGPWRASIRLTSGALTRTSAATLTFSRLTGGAAGSRRSLRFVMIVVALLVLGVTAAAAVRSRPLRRVRRAAPKQALPTEPRPVGGWHSR
jgi:hypothetical protein